MRSAFLKAVFGAKAQVAVGVVCTLGAVVAWAYWTLVEPPTVGVVFHVSMAFGVAACYAIIATGLGYRATERVEAHVTGNGSVDVDVDHAEEVNVR